MLGFAFPKWCEGLALERYIVRGNLSHFVTPFERLIPRRTLSNVKQFESGLGNPFSTCNDHMAKRYMLIDEAMIVLDKCVTNDINVHSDAGSGELRYFLGSLRLGAL